MTIFWLCLAVSNVAAMASYILSSEDMSSNDVLGFVLNMLSFWLAILALVHSGS